MSNGFDNVYRYLLRSTGNLLAYLASVGVVIVGFAITSYHKTKAKAQLRARFILSASTLITVFVAAFSGLFFLETARIWLFFTPFFCILAAASLQEYLFRKQYDLIAVTVLTTVLISILEEIYIDHAFGYFARGW
jgi:uncharacterized membrane protein